MPRLDEEEVVERLRMLEKNRHLREKLDMVKDKFLLLDAYWAAKQDKRDLSDEE